MRGSRSLLGDRGTIFIESMIAAAIVAVMLGGLYQSMSASAARHRMSEQRRTALMIAQSRLAGVGSELPIVAARTATVEGDYLAQVDVEPYATEAPGSSAGRLALVTVVVRRRDDDRPLVSLRSLRLGSG